MDITNINGVNYYAKKMTLDIFMFNLPSTNKHIQDE